MATTSSKLMAGKVANQGSNGSSGRNGLKAKLATGLAVLGCAAALTFGGVRLFTSAQSATATNPTVPQAASTHLLSPIGRTGPADEYLQAEFTPVRQVITRTGPADEYTQTEGVPTSVDWEQVERAQVAPSLSPAPVDWEQEERGQVAP